MFDFTLVNIEESNECIRYHSSVKDLGMGLKQMFQFSRWDLEFVPKNDFQLHKSTREAIMTYDIYSLLLSKTQGKEVT